MKIAIKNTEKLATSLAAVQTPRVSARTIEVGDFAKHAAKIEAKLSKLLCKKDWVGLVVVVDDNAQTFASSYNGTPESTKFKLTRTKSGWDVTAIARGYTSTHEHRIIGLETRADRMLAFAIKNF